MKNPAKKSIGALLILLFMFSTLSSCVNPDTNIGKQPEADNEHTHAFEWVIDLEPTYTTPGVKHMECTCGEKTDINTVADRLVHQEVVSKAAITNDSSMYTQFAYNYAEDLNTFYKSNKEKINATFLAVNATTDADRGIYVVYEGFWTSYVFSYEDDIWNVLQEGYDPKEYKNPVVTISFDLYSVELDENPDQLDYDGPKVSIVFLMHFCDIGSESVDPTFEFYAYDDGKSALKDLIRVYNQGKCIGEIWYGADSGVSREWIVSYLTENLYIIK